jgi:hypothetical protein
MHGFMYLSYVLICFSVHYTIILNIGKLHVCELNLIVGDIGGMGGFGIETFHKSTNVKHKKDDGERHIKCKYLMEVGRVLKGEYSGRVGLYNKGVGY